jgi:hypothetical protein
MGGGLLQLVAYGAQDVYLTGNPQITFFKVVYRRHTNFSIESIVQSPNGNSAFGSRITCQISRNGDLLHKLMLEATIDLPETSASSPKDAYIQPWVGYNILKSLEIEIGGQRIDKQYGQWMYIWNELTCPSEKYEGMNRMISGQNIVNSDNNPYKIEKGTAGNPDSKKINLKIPLEFWFCRNVGLALPLIALQYHEVKINIEFNEKTKVFITHSDTNKYQVNTHTNSPSDVVSGGTSNAVLSDVKLYADYIFLDTDERRRFAQLSHEYLIEQVQFTGSEAVTDNTIPTRLNFNHPVKELIWVNKNNGTDESLLWNCFVMPKEVGDKLYTKGGINSTTNAQLKLNGNDRFAPRDGNYFNLVQPYQHHTNIPMRNPGINVYSFALKPEEHQPSGTLNMSRIDSAQLSITHANAGNLYVYAVNYNVLRILSGMGGLAYSN